MKRIIVGMAVGLVLAGVAGAVSRKEFGDARMAALQPVYQNDGDTAAGFAVEASSSAWTAVAAARATRRRLFVQVLDSNVKGVCLSTFSTVAIACDDATPGIELSTGTANSNGLRSHTFYTQAAIYARIRVGDTNPLQRVKGYESYDSGD